MPTSDFKKLKREMTGIIFQFAMLRELNQEDSSSDGKGSASDSDPDDALLSRVVEMRAALDSLRYSVERKNVVRSTAHRQLVFQLRDDDFRKFTRVTKSTFEVLLEMIRDDVKALLRHFPRLVSWPSRRQWSVTSAFYEERFGLIEGVVGFVDETHVIFDQKPHINGGQFYNRKCRYSFNVQIVCNEDKLILLAFTGWPGSCCDSTVFSKMPIAKQPHRYFSDDEYLIGDTGYVLSTRMVTPYKRPAADTSENTAFNEVISSARVINENCIGLLKNRWMSLKGIRTQIKTKNDFRHVNNHVLACAMLHNFGLILGDEWDDTNLKMKTTKTIPFARYLATKLDARSANGSSMHCCTTELNAWKDSVHQRFDFSS